MESKSEIIIYKSGDGQTAIDVRLEQETVWLTQEQISLLFERERSVITKHINNIFTEGELDEKVVCAKFAHTTQHGAIKGKTQETTVKYYNLDVIISTGYRVKSKQGTQFRQWATQRLKDFLVKGYALNEKRLQQYASNLKELEKAVNLIQLSGNSGDLKLREVKGLVEIITNYTKSFILLNQFDSNNLITEKLNENITYEIQYDEAVKAITELKKQLIAKKEAAGIFGNQKDESFKGILGNIVQSVDGDYLYKSIEEQAAHLCIS